MNKEVFWGLVAASQGSAEKLKQLLLAYLREEIISFNGLLDEALYQLDREDIHEVTGGSDDSFERVDITVDLSAGGIIYCRHAFCGDCSFDGALLLSLQPY